jgi:urease accessory protein
MTINTVCCLSWSPVVYAFLNPNDLAKYLRASELAAVNLSKTISTVTTQTTNWQAHLSLGFTDDAGTTRLTERTHSGPLRVQKPLYPEAADLCHAIIVHPPGGVVGGDELHIKTQVGDHARALITTPGAAKWYKANGKISQQTIHIDVGAKASIEWLPQETIFFNNAHVRLNQTITLGKDSSYLGCDILCFGRTASGESFDAGQIEQRTTIAREGKLLWFEQGAILAGTASMHGAFGLGGNTVCATFIAVGKMVSAALITALRDAANALLQSTGKNLGAFGVTQLKSVTVVRYLGNSSEIARKLMLLAWEFLRPEFVGRQAIELRMWNT